MIAVRNPSPGPSAVRLACRLRTRVPPPGRPPSPAGGELELENLSTTPLDIPAGVHPLQHLNLEVTDAQGSVVSDGWYGNRFSPSLHPADLHLPPGGTYVHPVHLLGTVPADRLRPGTYTVQAVYDCPGLRAVSDPLTLTI